VLNSLDLKGPPSSHRVVVAMSGGVDSSVVAALLKKADYDVVGVTLRLVGCAITGGSSSCADEAVMSARRVASLLDIHHHVVDLEDRFNKLVVDYFTDSYVAGETPVPCVICNERVKLAGLFESAEIMNASIVATGHYVGSRLMSNGRRALFRPIDEMRDQSYFLCAISQDWIDRLRFPLEGMSKSETRAMAHKMGLPVFAKRDSQDICFIPSGNYVDLVKRLRPNSIKPGNILHVDGRVLGQHDGIASFTVGQRRGIKIASDRPLYVVRLKPETDEVIVGYKEDLFSKRLILRNFNWIGDNSVESLVSKKIDVWVRIRSRCDPIPASLSFDESCKPVVDLLHGEYGVAIGQACAFYENGDKQARVLGGGIIHFASSGAGHSREEVASS